MNIKRQIWLLEWIIKANTFRVKKDVILEALAEELLKELKQGYGKTDSNNIKVK